MSDWKIVNRQYRDGTLHSEHYDVAVDTSPAADAFDNGATEHVSSFIGGGVRVVIVRTALCEGA